MIESFIPVICKINYNPVPFKTVEDKPEIKSLMQAGYIEIRNGKVFLNKNGRDIYNCLYPN